MVAHQGSGAQTKGKKYERKIAKQLTKMFPGIEFNRTAYSGSTSNFSAQSGVEGFTGDLFPSPDSILSGVFSFELKNHDKFKLAQIFNNGAVYKEFLQQNVTDARRQGYATPVLIMHSASEREDILTIPFQDNMYESLVEKGFPAMITQVQYMDKRTTKVNKFNMIVTTLKGFGSMSERELHSWYNKLDWDISNKHQEGIDFPIDIDNLVNNLEGDKS